MVFTTEGLFEVAIESWPEWDLNPRPMNTFRRSNRLSYQAMSSTRTQPEAFNFIKKETLIQVFSCEFCKSFKKNFFTERLPLLHIANRNKS